MNGPRHRIDDAAAAAAPMPELQASRWFNTASPVTIASLRGRVVMLHAFQMLCPGCVMYGIPQAVKVEQAFGASKLAVIGLHTVFEHHDVMGPAALQAFIGEYRLRFPVAVDEPDGRGGVPRTMAALGLEGTPSIVLLDRQGQIRLQHFGRLDDLLLGAAIGQLLAESDTT